LFIFASFLTALEIEFTRNEDATRELTKSQQRIFTLFFAVSSRWEFFNESLLSLKRKFPINYKNKHLGEERKKLRESQEWILALQSQEPQEHSSLIPEKIHSKCNRISHRRQKIEFPRQHHNVFRVLLKVL
jgi:hypothetical protein